MKVKILVVLLLVLVLGGFYSYLNSPEKKIETVQDLVDYDFETGQMDKIISVSEGVDTHGYDIPIHNGEDIN